MRSVLIWMPEIHARDYPSQFFPWVADRFLRGHGGIGHVVADRPGPWGSLEITNSQSGRDWYCTIQAKPPKIPAKKNSPGAISVDMLLPQGAQDPILDYLDQLKRLAPLRRLIIQRPKNFTIARAQMSLRTLYDALSVPIWLDLQSFGWDAVSFLCAADPALQISGVPDHEAFILARLAEIVERPLVLSDLSSQNARTVNPLPRYDDEKGAARVLKALPYWVRSR